MTRERFIVYRVIDQETSELEEMRVFNTHARARDWAEAQGWAFSIEWQRVEISRNGLDILESAADLLDGEYEA